MAAGQEIRLVIAQRTFAWIAIPMEPLPVAHRVSGPNRREGVQRRNFVRGCRIVVTGPQVVVRRLGEVPGLLIERAALHRGHERIPVHHLPAAAPCGERTLIDLARLG